MTDQARVQRPAELWQKPQEARHAGHATAIRRASGDLHWASAHLTGQEYAAFAARHPEAAR